MRTEQEFLEGLIEDSNCFIQQPNNNREHKRMLVIIITILEKRLKEIQDDNPLHNSS